MSLGAYFAVLGYGIVPERGLESLSERVPARFIPYIYARISLVPLRRFMRGCCHPFTDYRTIGIQTVGVNASSSGSISLP